jgi:membrane protein implicated in regulation of membrane protease activity
MSSGANNKLGASGVHLLVAMGVFALLTAIVAVPAIAEMTGINQTYVTYVVAAICFVFAVTASRWVRSLNAKNAAEKK